MRAIGGLLLSALVIIAGIMLGVTGAIIVSSIIIAILLALNARNS